MQLTPLKIEVTKERALSLIREYKDAPYKEPTDKVIQTTVATDVATVLTGGTPVYPVNPEALK